MSNMLGVLKLARRDLVKYSNSGLASGRSVNAGGYLVSLGKLDEIIKTMDSREKAWKEISRKNRKRK